MNPTERKILRLENRAASETARAEHWKARTIRANRARHDAEVKHMIAHRQLAQVRALIEEAAGRAHAFGVVDEYGQVTVGDLRRALEEGT